MPEVPNIALVVSFKQVFKLAQQLPPKEKNQLEQDVSILLEEHKKVVRQRVKKYNRNPKLLIDEDKALKMINAL